jgi:hypothetical protein
MKQRRDRRQPRVDADGVRIAHHGRASLLRSVLLIATAITVSLAALLVIRTFERPQPVPGPDPTGHASIDSAPARVPRRAEEPTQVAEPMPVKDVRTAVRRRTGASAAGNRPQDESKVGAGEEGQPGIDARDYIAALRAGGETEGLAAFSPPGTRPPRTGVMVPDDYVLPEGFARHYQTTDDGRRLAPILTVAPEYELLDEAGNPVPLTEDHIVPPEFVPPDLPVRMLEIPSEDDRGQGDR